MNETKIIIAILILFCLALIPISMKLNNIQKKIIEIENIKPINDQFNKIEL